MSKVVSASTGRRYSLQRVCRVWDVPRSTVYHHRRAPQRSPQRKRGPKTALSDQDLLEAIRGALEDSPWTGEGYRKVWARLRLNGVRTSKERVRRLMRDAGLQAPHSTGTPRGPKAHDGRIITDRPDEMWAIDLTTCFTGEGNAAIFAIVDHCTAECIAIHASARGTRFEAIDCLRQGVRRHFHHYGEDAASGLRLRHDHGSAFMSDLFQQELAFLGIDSSPAFVREPQGNGCVERFFRTLKEQLLWIQRFDSVEALRQALIDFMHRYNHEWLIERHGHASPAAARAAFQLGAAA